MTLQGMSVRIYIFLIIFHITFSPRYGFPLALLWSFACLLWSLYTRRNLLRELRFQADDALFGLVFLSGCFAIAVTSAPVGGQNITYMIWWLGSWILLYWWVREWLLCSRIRFADITRTIRWTLLVLAGAVIFEFLLVQTTGLFFSDILPTAETEIPFAFAFGAAYARPRVFSVEAGFVAILFNLMLPFFLANLRLLRPSHIVQLAVVMVGYLLLFSAASIAAGALTMLIHIAAFARIRIIAATVLAAMMVLLAYAYVPVVTEYVDQTVIRKVEGLFLVSQINSVYSGSRLAIYATGFEILLNNPLGIGWGGISQEFNQATGRLGVAPESSGMVSIPLEVAVSTGIFGGLLFLLWIAGKLLRLVRRNSPESRVVFFAATWVVVHHFFVLEFWMPTFWLALALCDVVCRQNTGEGRRFSRLRLPQRAHHSGYGHLAE